MISGAYTSSEKAGRLFFKRTAVFFWEDSEWGAGLFARAPKGEPVYFSMICSDSSSRRRHASSVAVDSLAAHKIDDFPACSAHLGESTGEERISVAHAQSVQGAFA